MPYKIRTESEELKKLRILNARMELTPDDKQYYLTLENGYEGEGRFDSYTACFDNKFYVLNDLLLKCGKSTFQLDTIIITQEAIFQFEIKNHSDDYYYDYKMRNFIKCNTNIKMNNPLYQLHKSMTQLQNLLQFNGFHYPIEGHVVFINPKFFLYQAPLNEPIIYHHQVDRLINNLCDKPAKLTFHHRNLADFLLKSHITNSPFSQVPPYKYGQLRKGNICASCQTLLVSVGERKVICRKCGHEEKFESAVIRGVEEIIILFPDMKITTNIVCEWCGLENHKKTIRRILLKNYNAFGNCKHTFYIKK
jgi:hypothetical protein